MIKTGARKILRPFPQRQFSAGLSRDRRRVHDMYEVMKACQVKYRFTFSITTRPSRMIWPSHRRHLQHRVHASNTWRLMQKWDSYSATRRRRSDAGPFRCRAGSARPIESPAIFTDFRQEWQAALPEVMAASFPFVSDAASNAA